MEKFQYKHYLLILLTVVAALNYVDRHIVALLMEPIKQDLQLSDSQLGFLTGFAFALFYAVAGIPISRWADRGNRNTIVFATTALWSSMVAVCGLVGNYSQLLLARVGVAVGEAGCLPTGQSLISDYFNRSERPHAMAIYWLCSPLAMIIAYLGGGFLFEYLGWRMTFVAVGLPGVLIAVLVKFTLREPRQSRQSQIVSERSSFKVVLATLSKQRTFRHIVMAFCVNYFFTIGAYQWIPTFFVRSYGMETSEVGSWLALIWGVCGLAGTYVGGYLTTRFAARKESSQMLFIAIVHILLALLFTLIYLSFNVHISLLMMAVITLVGTSTNAAIFAAIQSLTSERMRSTALALIFLLANLIGAGLGPIVVGISSDLLTPSFGQESLRYALLLFSPGLLLVAYQFWKASITIEEDINTVELYESSKTSGSVNMSQGTTLKKLGLSKS